MTPTVILTIRNDPDAVVTAQRLLRRGARVAVTGPDLGALLIAVRGYGAGRAMVLVGDVDDPADIARMRGAAETGFGPIDVVIPAGATKDNGELASVHRIRDREAIRQPMSGPEHRDVA